MFDLLKRHEVQVLLRAGHTQKEVAGLAGISVRSVRRIVSEPPITSLEPGSLRVRNRRAAGRPTTVLGFRQFVVHLLSEAPRLQAVELLRRARRQGYAGGASTFYAMVGSVKKEMSRAATPGAVAEHAFGRVDVHFANNAKKRIRFLVTRLLHHRWIRISIVSRLDLETFIRTLVDHYGALGGVPLLSMFDHLDPLAFDSEHDGIVTHWNPVFAEAALQLGIAVEVRGVRHSSLVKWAKASFFRDRCFEDEEELATRLIAWHRKHDAAGDLARDPQSHGGAALGLRPLKVKPEDFALRVPVCVGPDAGIWYEENFYAMPPEAKNRPATMLLYRDRVLITAGPYRAEHSRLFGVNERSSLPALGD